MSERQDNPSPVDEPRGASAPDAADAAAPPPRKKRRIFLRVLAAFVLLLVALVGVAPYVAAMPAVTGYLLNFVNHSIRGRIELAGARLSWFGANELRGVRVVDPANREVLTVGRVATSGGVLSLVRGGWNLGELVVDAPKATLYLDATDDASLVDAFRPRQPQAASTSSSETPDIRAHVVVNGGALRAVRENGPSYDLPLVEADVDLHALGAWIAKLQVKAADGATVHGSADLRGLLAGGQFSLDQAAGTIDLRSDAPVDAGQIMAVVAPRLGLQGKVTLNLAGTIDAGQGKADYSIDVRGLQTADRAATRAVPLNLQVIGKATHANGTISARADMASEAVNAKLDLVCKLGGAQPAITAEELVAAIVNGKAIQLPEFTLGADGTVDLVKLQQAVPGLLTVREGQQITGGRLEFSKLAMQGGSAPTVSGSVVVRDLAATGDGRTFRVEPIKLTFNAILSAGKGLLINGLDLQSSFAQFNATGSAADLQASFKADLARLQQEIGQIFDLSGINLAGSLDGTLSLARAGDERIDVKLAATGNSVKCGSGSKQFAAQRISLAQAGHLSLKDQQPTRVEVTELKADLDGQVVAAATGWVDVRQPVFSARVDVSRADLSFAASRAKALGLEGLSRFGGSVSLQATLDRPDSRAAVAAGGKLATKNLTLDGQPLLEGDSRLELEGASLAADGRSAEVRAAKLESSAATVNARSVRWQAGQTLDLRGDLDASADLRGLFRAVAAITGNSAPPKIGGRASLNSKLTTAGGVVSIAGRGGIDNLEVGTGAQTIREKRLDLEIDAQLDSARDRLGLGKCRVNSAPLTAEVAGNIDQLSKSAVCSLTGRYDASWQHLTALLHEFVPSTAKVVIVEGRSASEFKIEGPVNAPGGRPVFRGMATGADVTWAAAELYGVALAEKRISPKFRDGVLTIPPTKIEAMRGSVNLAGKIDFQPEDPTLQITERLQLLDKVVVTPELGQQLLSHINPIFMQLARVEGIASMSVAEIALPVNDAIKRKGTGKGVLDLAQMKMQPGGFLAELFSLGGYPLDDLYPTEIGRVNFTLKDGRLYYDDFTLGFPNGFNVKFYGSVGFDDTLDLVVSLPVSEGLLNKLKIRGPAASILAGDLRVDIPMVGTREKPRLDFAKVDTQKLLKSLLQPQNTGKVLEKGLGDLLNKQGKEQQPPPEEPAPAEEEKPRRRRR